MSHNANFGASRYQKMLMDGPPHIILTTPQELNVPHESSNPLEEAVELRLQSAHDLAGSNVPMEHKGKKDWMPELGMKFESEEQAYEFYNRYAVKIGFSVRKDWLNKSRNGVVQSRRYCCYKEGHRKKDRRHEFVKNPRNETRTGCMAHMIITIQPDGKYRISKFEAAHNHEFVTPEMAHMLKSHKKSTVDQGTTDADGIRPKSTLKARDRHAEDHEDNDFLKLNCSNYLHSKRMKAMKEGDAGALLQYFQRKQLENPAFFYAIQLDVDDRITNIFWSDAKMVLDYGYFGDVVCLDTTYRSNDYGRPFSLFLGTNHHKQLVIFGAALLYDETTESFKWLFETFLEAMSGKMPKTVLTDQDTAISNAVASGLPETCHRICVWHVYQNALKQLSHVFNCHKSFAKDFSSCLYDHEEDEDFIQAWGSMLEKYNLTENVWLNQLFKERDQWALVYGRDTFCADIKSAQRSVSMDSILRKYLNIELDVLDFFQHFESLVEDRRYEELKSNFEMSQTTPKLVLPVKMLKQVVGVYTPVIYEMFQKEYVESLDCVVRSCNELGTTTEYKVIVVEKTHENTVTFNSLNGTIFCSCKKFEFVGILCSHAVKILDLRNIKVLPPQYILNRWTKDAKSGSMADGHVCTVPIDHKFDLSRRYKELCGSFVKIAARAVETEETYTFAANYSEQILQGVEEILKRKIHEEPLGAASNGTGALTAQSRH